MTVCKLCFKKECKLIKAHAIPEAFFRVLRTENQTPLLVSAKSGNFPKKSLIGVYDEQILCEVCEPAFGPLDDFGVEVLLKSFSKHFEPFPNPSKIAAFKSSTIDPGRLLQFLVSILWRASVSSQAFYSNVSLGPHEEAASKATIEPNEPVSPVFDAVLSKWQENETTNIPTTAMLNPHPEKWYGVNAYRLYLGEITAFIKVDSRPFPEKLRVCALSSAPPIVVVMREMNKSKDLQAMKYTAKQSHKNAISFKKTSDSK